MNYYNSCVTEILIILLMHCSLPTAWNYILHLPTRIFDFSNLSKTLMLAY